MCQTGDVRAFAVVSARTLCLNQVFFYASADLFDKVRVGLGCVCVLYTGTAEQKLDESLQLTALVEQRRCAFDVPETESEEVVDEVGVVLTVLSLFEDVAVRVTTDELKRFLEQETEVFVFTEVDEAKLD